MSTLAMQKIRKSLLAMPLILTLSSAIPFIFHLMGLEGIKFLPIYLTILVGAYFVSINTILIVSLLTPLFNYLFTGMPIYFPMPILQILTVELFSLAIGVALLKNKKIPLILKITIPVFIARMSSIIMLLFYNNLTFKWFFSSRILGLSGVVLNIFITYIILRKFYVKK